MFHHRAKHRGLAALLATVLTLIAIVGCKSKDTPPKLPTGSGSALEMAKLIPSSVRATWAWDLNGEIDYVDWARELKEIGSKAEPNGAKEIAEFEEKLGMPAEDWLKLFNGKGYIAILESGSLDKPSFIGAIGLAQPKEYETWWKKQSADYKLPTEEKKIEGITFLSLGAEPTLIGHDDQWLYFATSESEAKTVLEAVKGAGDNLTTNPQYSEGLKNLEVTASGAFGYLNVKSLLKTAQASNLPDTDEEMYKELSALEYVVGSANFSGLKLDIVTKVGGDSNLAKALLTPGSLTGTSLESLAKSSSANNIDVKWMIESFTKMAMVVPDARPQASMIGLGLMSQGNPWDAFTGEIAVSSNVPDTMVEVFSDNFTRARGIGQFTACKSNLKNIGTASEMYSTDWSGRYPTSASALVPNYLKTIPNCPAAGEDTYSESYKSSQNPDNYSVYCAGHHHKNTKADFPKYNAMEGLDDGGAVREAPPEPTSPSTAIVVSLKDAKSGFEFINKMMPLGGEPPKEGEETEYDAPVPDLSIKISNKGKPFAVLGVGPEAAKLQDASKETAADIAKIKELKAWGSEGMVYIDYLNLEPVYNQAVESLKKSDESEAKVGLQVLEMLKRRSPALDGASCVVVKPYGVHYRSVGISNVSLLGVGAAILVPNFVRARSSGQTTACKSNLKNIGTALEMYSTDWSGHYPKDAGALTPNYLRTMPTCPSAGRDTYSATYTRVEAKEGSWESYKVCCGGENHIAVGIPANYPAYDGISGLTERP